MFELIQFAHRVLPASPGILVFGQGGAGRGVGVEQRALAIPRKQRLVIVRAVQIDQMATQFLERAQRGGAVVDELPVLSGGADLAFDNQLLPLARLQPGLFEQGIDDFRLAEGKRRFHRARLRAGSDEGAVGTLAEHEFERADDHGFAGPGFPGDPHQSRPDFPEQIFHERQIPDA